ncbi:translocation and assembly module protein TamB [Pseudorhodobacter sp. E13]|uniref:translocation/assembly module TamB domain-containing protein n=1 Tax=Pseudorhodobacter sp. E13 TaxID=2487931 RepID=UPI000F8D334F|nr:translocation/assembly module TamB domain-containing protein [Pseudorhodobacter sp. E13]RUS58933.1 translocation and assembly module protein TamB [Pseudorhodobacter sp. E13]
MQNFWRTLFVFLLLPVLAFAQSDDRDTLTAFLEDNLSSAGRQVTVTGFSGAFSSQAQIESLTIADTEGVWLTLNGVVLDWSRASLLRGVVSVNELVADEVIVARKPVPDPNAVVAPEASGFSLPELPVSVTIEKLSAKRIALGAEILGQAFEGSLEAAAVLDGGQGNAELTLLRTDAGPDASLSLKVAYANATRELSVDLDLAEAEGGIGATLLGLPGTPSVALRIAGAGPLDDFTADLDLRTDGEERLQGSLTLTGQDDGGQGFRAAINGDVAPLFLPEYAAFFGTEVRLEVEGARSNLGRLDLTALTLDTRAIRLDGSAMIAADGLPQKLSLVGRLGFADGAPVLLPIAGEVETRVSSADLRLSFDAAQGDGWSGAVNLTGLQRDDVALGQARISGSGRINRRAGSGGPIVGGTLVFDAQEVALADPALARALGSSLDGRMVFDWQQGGLGFRIGRLTLREEGYDIVASVRFGDLESGFRLKGSVDARYDDLSRLSDLAGREIGGAAAFRISGQAVPLGGEFDAVGKVSGTDIRVGIAEVDNLLQGGSEIDFAAGRSTKGTFLRSLNVTAQDLRVNASGKLASDGSDLKGKLQFADLSALGAQYSGSLNADASFSGTPAQGRITLDGLADGLRIGQKQVDALTAGQSRLSVDVGLNDGRFDITKATINNQQIAGEVTGFYAPAGSDLALDVALPSIAPLGPGYRGALSAEATFKGTVDAGRVEVSGLGTGLALGVAEADRVLAGQSRLAGAANFKGRRIEIETLTLSNPQVTLAARGSVTDDQRRLQLEATLANLALLAPDFPGRLTVAGSAVEDGNGVVLDLAGTGPGGIDASVSGRIAPSFNSANLAIRGTARAELANAFISPRSVSGQTAFDLRLNGPLALSSLAGSASLSQGRLSAPNLPFGLQDLQATANLGGNAVQLSVAASPSTGGRMTVDGSIGLAAPNVADLRVGLTDGILKDPDLYEVNLGGNVVVQGPLQGGASISGAISIREAEIQVPTTGFAALGSLPGLKHKNEPAAVKATRYKAGLIDLGTGASQGAAARPFGLDLTISAPSRIFIRGRGIDAELGGSVQLRGTTDNVIPSGGFDLIRGRLDILGKRLDLDTASVVLQGDLIPYINIVAINEGDDVTTSVVIEGRADEPEITFQSVPDLPQEEVLAQLLFGQGLDQISPLQAAQLASAVATLAGKGGEGIVSKLRSGFGLDDLDFSTDSEGNISLKAGKYLSKRVYSEVEVDQDGRSQINLNLDLKKNVTVRGSVAADGEAGLGIFFEKDY